MQDAKKPTPEAQVKQFVDQEIDRLKGLVSEYLREEEQVREKREATEKELEQWERYKKRGLILGRKSSARPEGARELFLARAVNHPLFIGIVHR